MCMLPDDVLLMPRMAAFSASTRRSCAADVDIRIASGGFDALLEQHPRRTWRRSSWSTSGRATAAAATTASLGRDHDPGGTSGVLELLPQRGDAGLRVLIERALIEHQALDAQDLGPVDPLLAGREPCRAYISAERLRRRPLGRTHGHAGHRADLDVDLRGRHLGSIELGAHLLQERRIGFTATLRAKKVIVLKLDARDAVRVLVVLRQIQDAHV